MDFFTRDAGVSQGRIRPQQGAADHGDHVVCLGSDVPRRFAMLGGNDGVTLSQTTSSTARFLRPRIHLRPAATPPPAGTTWAFEFAVDGDTVLSLELDRARDLSDVTALVPAGPFPIEFVLRLSAGAGLYEAELPAVYIDALFEEPAGGASIQLINRLPERDETHVPRDTTIQIDITTEDVAGPSLGATRISVNDEIAYDNEAILDGWDSAGSGVTIRDGGHTQRIILAPAVPFASQSRVEINVVSFSVADNAPLNETYSFTIEDYTAPAIVSAVAVDLDRVRVTLAESVVSAEALDPTNWTFAVVQGAKLVGWGSFRYGPALPVNAASVVQISPLVYEIITDHAFTQRASYRLTCVGVHDTSGNEMAAPTNAATFLSYDCRDLDRDFELVHMVPSIAVRLDQTEDLRKVLWLWQETFELLMCLVDRWLRLLDPDEAPEVFVDAMLQDLGNPFRFALTAIQKRKLVGLLVPLYRQKGSAEGIVNAVRTFLGIEIRIVYPAFVGLGLGEASLGDTFVLGGDPYDMYGYEVVAGELTSEQREQIRQIAEYMQAANEHLLRFVEPPISEGPVDHVVLGVSNLDDEWILH